MDIFKKEISKQISKITNIDEETICEYIETPKEKGNGDYAFPCFKLAKELKKAPPVIANEIKEKLEIDEKLIEKFEVVGGYINFFVNKQALAKEVIAFENDKKEKTLGKGQTVVIDYSAPNIAKPFHIGHLRTTLIGGALYNIYKYLGYNTVGVNHLGDYGTQFGKLIEGYRLWGSEYDLDKNPIEDLTDMYIRINNLCKEDEKVLEACRDNFKKLEDGVEYCVSVWKKFKEVSLKEFQKIYDVLGTKFDSWNGEAFYADKMLEVIEMLEKSGHLIESQGAQVVDLEDQGISTPCMIRKSNGSTTYATRDLAAILYRSREYDYDKAIYVTSYEQILHFKQVFATAKYLDIDEKYVKGLEHVPYGMVLLPTGKMSTREGNMIKLEDLLNEAMERAGKIIAEKNPNLENKAEVAKKVGVGAVIFHDLVSNRVKDEIFEWDEVLNFQGETGPYIQYTYVRTKSILDKANYKPNADKVDLSCLEDEYSQDILKLIYQFDSVLEQVTVKNEPAFLARYLIDIAKAYSTFYNENKIIGEEENVQEARLYLTYMVSNVLKTGVELLGMRMPKKM